MLIQTIPSGIDHSFRELGQAIDGVDVHPPTTGDEVQRLKAEAPRPGIEFLG